MIARAHAGRRPRVHLGVINHTPSDIYFSVEGDIWSALNVSIQCLVESSLRSVRESSLCCVIKSFLVALPTLLACAIDRALIISERETPAFAYMKPLSKRFSQLHISIFLCFCVFLNLYKPF